MFLILSLSACENTDIIAKNNVSDPISKSDFSLDTICTITVYSKNDEKLIDESFKLISQYEAMLSRTVADSDISRINKANGRAVSVSNDTIEVIEKANYYSEKSKGLFDISIGAITSKWDFSNASSRTVPNENEILKLLPSVDYKNIHINKNNIVLITPDTMLDLGAIAKGYIADKVANFLIENDVDAALIDLGGNIVTIGTKAEGDNWNIGVRNPLPQDDGDVMSMIGFVEVEGRKSIGTSGTYERYFEQDGIRYHHILDTKTGYPASSDLAGVTVITDESVDGEGYTTICILLGSEAAVGFLEENNIDAVLVKEDGTILTTGLIKFTPLEQ